MGPGSTPATASVVLPVYNQEDHLERVVEGYREALDAVGQPYELVLVTNACRDASAEIAEGMAEASENVRHVDLGALGGWGRAVRAGLAEARGEVVCFTNSARTPPEVLALMLLYARVHPGVALKANRKIRESWVRRAGSLLYNLECRVLFDLPTWDVNGTPKVFPRSFSRLLELRRDDDLIDLEFNTTCKRAGYPIVEVPVQATDRHGGESTTKLSSAFRLYLGAWRLRRSAG